MLKSRHMGYNHVRRGDMEASPAHLQTLQFQEALVQLSRDEWLDLSGRLERFCSVAATMLDVARVSIWLFNDTHTELHCVNLYNRPQDIHENGAVLDVGRYPRYFDTLEQCRTIASEDARNDPSTAEFASGYLDTFGITSMLDVPIRREGRTVGVVCNEHVGLRRQWSDDEKNFAASLSDLIALACETDRRRQYNQRLKLLRDVDRAILSVRSVEEIGEAALGRFQELVPCDRTSVAVFDNESGMARIVGVSAAGESQLGKGREVPLEFFGDRNDLLMGKPYVISNIDDLPMSPVRRALEAEQIRCCVSVPLLAGDELIGTLNLGSRDHDTFHAEHIEIAQEVADSLAVAIRHAHLNQISERYAAELEQRVNERTAELSIAEERLSGIFRCAMDAIVVIDSERKIVIFNHAAETVFRCPASEAAGLGIGAFLSQPLEQVLTDYMTTASAGAAEQLWLPEGLRAVRKTGEAFLIEATVSRTDVSTGMLFTIILRDIEERKRAEARLDQLQWENVYLNEELQTEFEEIVGASAAIQKVFASIEMVADTDSTVLLLGETGTGKELIARALHNRSSRKHAVLVKVNCGALPANLVESELFGHEKGAFTGAVALKKGRFEFAHRGTMFLDEVGELPLDIQTKLLRVVQEQEFERVGGSHTYKTDVRIIAATNRDLKAEVLKGNFRADLFYRLNVFPIDVPPLRDRKEDIPLLANYFLQKFSQRMKKSIHTISRGIYDQFFNYDWPGNIRELANVMERAVILCQGDTLQPHHTAVSRPQETIAMAQGLPTLEDHERRLILDALQRTGGVLAGPAGAAAILGINRSTLWSRMRKLGITTRRKTMGA